MRSTLCDSYVSTIVSYVGNERALTYELTPRTATGKLRGFLETVAAQESQHKQLSKYTELAPDGRRRFKRSKKVQNVTADVESEVRVTPWAAFL